MGLGADRYSYYGHFKNTGMTREVRLFWYNEQIGRKYSKKEGVMRDSKINTKFLKSELKQIAGP
jgi:hypothetical protein